jgi:hypothetical protein
VKGLNLKYKYKEKINDLQIIKNNYQNKMKFKVILKEILKKKFKKIIKCPK